MSTVSTFGSGNGATAPGAKPVACSTSSAFATRAFSPPAACAIFAASPRRSPGTSATTGFSSQTKDERLHDLIEAAAGGVGGVRCGRGSGRELLDAGLGAGVTEEGGHPLHGLRPGRYHGGNLPAHASVREADAGKWVWEPEVPPQLRTPSRA